MTQKKKKKLGTTKGKLFLNVLNVKIRGIVFEKY